MSATVSLLLLLFKASLLALGVSLSPALDPRCPAGTAISGAEELANITNLKHRWEFTAAVLFVHPDSGFEGVNLVAAGDGWRQDALFTLDGTCFPQKGVWWQLQAQVERDLGTNDHLLFKLSAGECSFVCDKSGHFPGDLRYTVVAHGPSRWRSTDPDPCTVIQPTYSYYKTVNCAKPSAPKTNTTAKTLSPTLDHRCPAATAISGAEERVKIRTFPTRGEYHFINLYVRPDPGFKSVGFVATGNGERSENWFKLDKTCFPQKGKWWKLRAGVNRVRNNDAAYLAFQVRAGECSLECRRVVIRGDMTAYLEAQGTSDWRLEDPAPCDVEDYTLKVYSRTKCTTRPRVPKITNSTTTKTTKTTDNTKIMQALLIVGISLVVAAAVVLKKRCTRRGSTPHVEPSRVTMIVLS